MVDPEHSDWKVSTKLRANAHALRRNSTDAERILWSELRAGRLNSVVFRRQVPIERYVADFICHAAKLVIDRKCSHGNYLTAPAAKHSAWEYEPIAH